MGESGRHNQARDLSREQAQLCNDDVDIYTTSKLLGHKNIATTQIYAKIIDQKKDEAVNRVNDIFKD